MSSAVAANALVWRLACRMFSHGQSVLEATLSAAERPPLHRLRGLQAVTAQTVDLRDALCPFCQLERGEVFRDAGGLLCRCPDCGPVCLEAEDWRAWQFDPSWLTRKLRQAFVMADKVPAAELGAGLWRVGVHGRSTVLLARRLAAAQQRLPQLLDAVVQGAPTLLIATPRPLGVTAVAPFGRLATWWPLEDQFVLYGGSVHCVASGTATAFVVEDDSAAAHGPFARDFRWVQLPDWPHGAIALSKMQAAVFRALWAFAGDEQEAAAIMAKAGSGSQKPIDVFKVKERHKGDPQYEGPRYAYQRLVVTNRRTGTYALPCARPGYRTPEVVVADG